MTENDLLLNLAPVEEKPTKPPTKPFKEAIEEKPTKPPAKPEEATPINQKPYVAILTRNSPYTLGDGLGQRVVCALTIKHLENIGVIPLHYDFHPSVFAAIEVSRHATDELSAFDDVLRVVDLNKGRPFYLFVKSLLRIGANSDLIESFYQRAKDINPLFELISVEEYKLPISDVAAAIETLHGSLSAAGPGQAQAVRALEISPADAETQKSYSGQG